MDKVSNATSIAFLDLELVSQHSLAELAAGLQLGRPIVSHCCRWVSQW